MCVFSLFLEKGNSNSFQKGKNLGTLEWLKQTSKPRLIFVILFWYVFKMRNLSILMILIVFCFFVFFNPKRFFEFLDKQRMLESGKDEKVAQTNTGYNSNRIKDMQLKLSILNVELAHDIAGQIWNGIDELSHYKHSHIDKVITEQSLVRKKIIFWHFGLEAVHWINTNSANNNFQNEFYQRLFTGYLKSAYSIKASS